MIVALLVMSRSASAGPCIVTGCSAEVCADEPVASLCEIQPWYVCYRQATCEPQADGVCGWTLTDELRSCLIAHGGPVPSVTPTAAPAFTPSPTPHANPQETECPGDCDGDGKVDVGEVMIGVDIALGALTVDHCERCDASGDHAITIDEILAAANSVLRGCPPAP